ncbi:MAG: hypothetical protein U0559_01170 [Anaerolineae bacterium]
MAHTACFGDFCEFCHGGNVQATDKVEAHTGMVEPMGDLSAAPAPYAKDYQAKATLTHKTLGASSTKGRTTPAQRLRRGHARRRATAPAG